MSRPLIRYWLLIIVGIGLFVFGVVFSILLPRIGHAPPSDRLIRFAIIGDYGATVDGGGEEARKVADAVKSWNPDFIVTTGDNNYPSGAAETIDVNVGQYYADYIGNYRAKYGKGSKDNRFFPVLGNHDYRIDDARAYLDYFTLPGRSGNTSGNERYYNFRWGPIEFFMMDSGALEVTGLNIPSREQYQWIKEAISSSNARWKFVIMHHSPFSSCHINANDRRMQLPFTRWGAHAVFSGHCHIYEYLYKSGMHYFVNGAGGGPTHSCSSMHPDSKICQEGHGAQLVTVSEKGVTIEFYSTNNAQYPWHSIRHSIRL